MLKRKIVFPDFKSNCEDQGNTELSTSFIFNKSNVRINTSTDLKTRALKGEEKFREREVFEKLSIQAFSIYVVSF